MRPDTKRMRPAYTQLYRQLVCMPGAAKRSAFVDALRLDPFTQYRLRRDLAVFERQLDDLERAAGGVSAEGPVRGAIPWEPCEAPTQGGTDAAPRAAAGLAHAAARASARWSRSVFWIGFFGLSAASLLYALIMLMKLMASIDTTVAALA